MYVEKLVEEKKLLEKVRVRRTIFSKKIRQENIRRSFTKRISSQLFERRVPMKREKYGERMCFSFPPSFLSPSPRDGKEEDRIT